MGFNGATSSRTWKAEHRLTYCGIDAMLQWSHVLTNVERSALPTSAADVSPALQWSHVLTNVERADDYVTMVGDSGAGGFNGATSSRTWKALPRQPESPRRLCFNGATSSRTWKAAMTAASAISISRLQWSHVLTNVESAALYDSSLGTDRLQWSHVLTNVESGGDYVRCYLPEMCFNGATSSRTWKGDPWRAAFYMAECASMEPRPHERGKIHTIPSHHSPDTCFNGATSSRTWKVRKRRKGRLANFSFNGATSSRTWKGVRGGGGGIPMTSFNGATSSRTWKGRFPCTVTANLPLLQWSHVLTNVESRVSCRR